MIKLAKYLKPYISHIIICFVLMIGQAICGLSLPGLTSDIVDIGILKNGIENVSPQAISKDSMRTVSFFMTDSQKEIVGKSYTLHKQGDSAYSSEYPKIAQTDIYIRNENAEQAVLDDIFGKSIESLRLYSERTYPGIDTYNLSELNSHSDDFSRLTKKDLNDIYAVVDTNDSRVLYQNGVIITKQWYDEIGMNIGNIETSYILRVGGLMLGITLGIILLTILSSLVSSKLTAGLSKTMRRDVFAKVESFSNGEFDEFSSSSLITRTTNDVSQVQGMLLDGIGTIFSAPIYGVLGIIFALSKSVTMSWTIAAGVLVSFIFLCITFVLVMPKFKIMQELVDKFNMVVRESLSGMMVIRGFGNEKESEKKFESVNSELTDINKYIFKVMVTMQPFMTIAMSALHVAMIWIAAKQIDASLMEVGDLLAFLQYGSLVISSFTMLATMFMSLPRAEISAKRIRQILEKEPSVTDLPNPIKLDDIKGKIEFKDVSFRYSNAVENVIDRVSFTILPGETTAFIGSTGCGKSTLVNLIPRFYDVTSGEILLDGVNIKNVSQKELRSNIGFVSQRSLLFSGDIKFNIRYGNKDLTDEELKGVLNIAQISGFIDDKKEGLEFKISQGGLNVSGGQRQRIAIARALAKHAPIYIFDDCFSALDFKTDMTIRHSLKERTKGCTVIIVAQRISTIINADKIVVLDKGKVVGMGTHNELLKTCKEYREIALSQFSEEELA